MRSACRDRARTQTDRDRVVAGDCGDAGDPCGHSSAGGEGAAPL